MFCFLVFCFLRVFISVIYLRKREIAHGAFTLFIAEGGTFIALNTAACVMVALIAFETEVNLMLAGTLFPSTLLARKGISVAIRYTIAHGISASIARKAYTIC